MIRLNVAFEEKDGVKSLGARWNGDEKFWYVPDGVDFRPFKKWIDADEYQNLLAPIIEVCEVPELFMKIAEYVHTEKTPMYCVTADVFGRYQYRDGDYIYNLCINHDIYNQRFRARITKDLLADKTPDSLKDRQLTVTGDFRYSPKDLDIQLHVSSFEDKGECSRIKEFKQWKQEYTDFLHEPICQKHKAVFPFEMVGLITGGRKNHAYNDFYNKIKISLKNNIVEKLVPNMDRPIPDIVNAIKELNAERSCQIICIVRGGGDPEILHQYSRPELLEAILDSQIPIITGIGHTKDELLCDHVSKFNAGTPSNAADHINYIDNIIKQRRERPQSRSKNDYDNRIDWQARCEKAEEQVEDLEQQVAALEEKLSLAEQELAKRGKRGLLDRIFRW